MNPVSSLQTALRLSFLASSSALRLAARRLQASRLLFFLGASRQTAFAFSFLASSSALRLAARRLQASRLLLWVPGHSLRARKDYSEAAATGQGPIHAADRAWRRPPRCIPSNWERSGKRPAGKAKPRLCITANRIRLHASSSLASLHRRENNCNLCIQLRKIQRQHAFAGMQHQVERPGQLA